MLIPKLHRSIQMLKITRMIALKAIKEMYYQKGSTLAVDESGRAENGLLIRHLVLPGHVAESKKVLKSIADELSPGVHLSLMSQYHPTQLVRNHQVLNRPLYRAEYESVVETMESSWFQKWMGSGYGQQSELQTGFQ